MTSKFSDHNNREVIKSNKSGDGNEKEKKIIIYMSKTTTLHVIKLCSLLTSCCMTVR